MTGTGSAPQLRVRDDPAGQRYVVTVAGEAGGLLEYRLDGGRMSMVHAEVEPRFRGGGVASTLVRGALDDVRRRELAVVPLCPYVVSWLERHPDYRDLIAS